MALRFLVQAEHCAAFYGKDLFPSSDVAAVVELIQEHNWLRPEDKIECTHASLESVRAGVFSIQEMQSFIPVGSIEFVEAVMDRAFGIKHLRPINIPMTLRKTSFFDRRLAICAGKEALLSIMEDWAVDKVFLKSADSVKCDYAGVYRKTDVFPDTADTLFVSEPIDILSEWRVFVYHGKVKDVRNYLGDPWVLPEKGIVQEMINSFGDELSAYTLDVAVTGSNKTVLIELHNFISCGLYGATLPLQMYAAAYKQEVGRRRPL